MAGTTPRLALPYPGGTDGPDGADVPFWIADLANALDGAALYSQGILSSRPVSTSGTPGIAGRLYYVTGDSTTANNGILWLDFGTGWTQVNGAGTILDVLANRAAANAVPAGTSFFATDQVAQYLSNGSSWTRVSTAAGVITMTVESTADDGYILLQGQTWPSTSGIYADLHTKWGGSTLPNFEGFSPVGYKPADSDFGTVLATGGEKKHTLSVGEMPSHDHGGATSGPNMPVPEPTGTSGSGGGLGTGSFWSDSQQHTHAITAQGGGLSHNNLPPFIVVNFQAKL